MYHGGRDEAAPLRSRQLGMTSGRYSNHHGWNVESDLDKIRKAETGEYGKLDDSALVGAETTLPLVRWTTDFRVCSISRGFSPKMLCCLRRNQACELPSPQGDGFSGDA